MISRIRSPDSFWCLRLQILIGINLVKKRKTESNIHNRKESCVKAIHVCMQQQQNCLFEKWHTHIGIVFNSSVFLPQSRRKIWSLSDCNWTRTHYQLVHKQTLNLLAKLAKWLSYVVSTYLYTAFDCMFLSRHVHISEWIQTLFLPKCQGTPCSKQVRDLKFKCLQLDSNPQPLSS